MRFLTRILLPSVTTLVLLPAAAMAQSVSKVLVTPNPVSGNSSATGVVTLSKPAPSAGFKVTLLSSAPKFAVVPASLTLAAGATNVTFVVTTEHVAVAERVEIEARDPAGHLVEVALTIEPPTIRLSKLTLTPALVQAGGAITGTVKLTEIAPSGGFSVNLSSKLAIASVPVVLFLPAGASNATCLVKTSKVTATTADSITATDANGYTVTEPLTVELPPVRVTKLTVTPSSVVASGSVTGTVTLSEPALKGGFTVNLSAQPSSLTLPTSITIKQGAKTGTFTGVAQSVRTSVPETLTAEDTAGYSGSASVTVNPPASFLTGITIGPSAIPSGSQATCYIQLSGPAPSGGMAVTLSTMQIFLSVPMTVTVPAGTSSAQVSLTAGTVAATSSATVTAVDKNGYSSTGTLQVSPKQTTYVVQATDGHQFLPTTISVPAGSVITWTNPSSMTHTVTSDVLSQGINSGVIGVGQSFCWIVPASAKSGAVYYYHCVYHGFGGNGSQLGQGMVGAVVVK